MKISQIIKEKRKEQNLTQEQIAIYLGVSTPAVNKWEKGSSYPDITLLPPLARLLKIDLNTLLSFHEDLSSQEIANFTNHLVTVIKNSGFEIGFTEAMAKIKEYPTCDMLIYMTAVTLEGALFMFGMQKNKSYKDEIETLYNRIAQSENEEIRNQAHAMLIARYMEREEYEKAQSLIDALPKAPVDKMQKQAQLYTRQNKLAEASELLESKLMSMASEMQALLLFMMEIAIKENKEDVARHLAEVSAQTVKLYDLWDYNAYIAHFQLAVLQKDADQCIALLQSMLGAAKSKWKINDSMLYQHMKAKEGEESFAEHMIHGLIAGIQNDESCDFLKLHPKFIELTNLYNQ